MKTRFRTIRRWGNSLVIVLRPSDEMDLNIKVGDMIDIEDAVRKTSISKDMAKTLKVRK
jgi:antitoxin component of MazEF toxin-antitoxin module